MQKITLTPVAEAPVHFCCPECGTPLWGETGEAGYGFIAGDIINGVYGSLLATGKESWASVAGCACALLMGECPDCDRKYYAVQASFSQPTGTAPNTSYQATATGESPWLVEHIDTCQGPMVVHLFPLKAGGTRENLEQAAAFLLERWDALKACSQELASKQ